MKPLTTEWVAKAEGDFMSAQRELRARKFPNYDLACFLAQQCAEKYLKARLQEGEVPFGKTHNLSELLDLVLSVEPAWEAMRDDLQALGLFAVDVRYPGFFAERRTARDAVSRCRSIRGIIRQALGLDHD